MPNPRGSYGQGEAFTQANRKDFGYGDLRDILAGVDAVEAKYPMDPQRVGITGWSYGGFMTMFAVTQTREVQGGSGGSGNFELAELLWPELDRPVDDSVFRGVGLRRSGGVCQELGHQLHQEVRRRRHWWWWGIAMESVRRRSRMSSGTRLRDHHVPTELVVYPNEGHGFVDPAHRRDVMDRAIDWFERYMPEPTH